jgi:hypothetical protein
MMVSLTFNQVREAGLPAWREDHLLYSPTLDIILSAMTRSGDDRLDVRSSSLRGDEPEMQTGWHHLRECRCVRCREVRQGLVHEGVWQRASSSTAARSRR